MYNKQCIFKVYNFMNFHLHIHLKNNHYNQDDKHLGNVQKFSYNLLQPLSTPPS